MSATVRVYLEDLDTAILTYQVIRLYSDTSPGGDFSTLVTTETIVAGTYEYLIEDPAGNSATWYRFTLYHATGPVESEQSPPEQAGVSLLWLRLEAARMAGAGFSSTATSGTITTLTDPVLIDSGVDDAFLAGSWIYRPDADSADRVRRMAEEPFNTSTGTQAVRRQWGVAPAADEVYHVFNLMPPIDQPGVGMSWDRAVRGGLERVRYEDQLLLGEGDGRQTRFSLETHGNQVNATNVQRVLLRTTDEDDYVRDRDAAKQGGYWYIAENSPGSLALVISPPPTDDETIVVSALVKDAGLYRDDDLTLVEPGRAVRAIVFEAYRMLNAMQPGKYLGELAWARENFRDSEDEYEPAATLVLV